MVNLKFGSSVSSVHDLPGGGPQGALVGGIEYMVNSNDNLTLLRMKTNLNMLMTSLSLNLFA